MKNGGRAANADLRQMLAALNQRMTELEQQLRSVAAPAK